MLCDLFGVAEKALSVGRIALTNAAAGAADPDLTL
jgi:hypothetical protein